VLWFAEYGGNAIARFEPKTNVIKEWQLPTPWGNPYDGSMMTDRVSRLDPSTDRWRAAPRGGRCSRTRARCRASD
jgi:hypothetical protein